MSMNDWLITQESCPHGSCQGFRAISVNTYNITRLFSLILTWCRWDSLWIWETTKWKSENSKIFSFRFVCNAQSNNIRFKSSGSYQCTVGRVYPEVSKGRNTLVLRNKIHVMKSFQTSRYTHRLPTHNTALSH